MRVPGNLLRIKLQAELSNSQYQISRVKTHHMANTGTMPFHRNFPSDYQDLGFQARNRAFCLQYFSVRETRAPRNIGKRLPACDLPVAASANAVHQVVPRGAAPRRPHVRRPDLVRPPCIRTVELPGCFHTPAYYTSARRCD